MWAGPLLLQAGQLLVLQELVMFNVIRTIDHGALFPQRSMIGLHGSPGSCVRPRVVELASNVVCDFLHLSHIGSLKSSPEAY